jgi:hypothetical protein
MQAERHTANEAFSEKSMITAFTAARPVFRSPFP